MPRSPEVEQFVMEYGEQYRGFIENALEFLDSVEILDSLEKENLGEPIDRSKCIEDLLRFSAGGY
jgi:hypothetical protein